MEGHQKAQIAPAVWLWFRVLLVPDWEEYQDKNHKGRWASVWLPVECHIPGCVHAWQHTQPLKATHMHARGWLPCLLPSRSPGQSILQPCGSKDVNTCFLTSLFSPKELQINWSSFIYFMLDVVSHILLPGVNHMMSLWSCYVQLDQYLLLTSLSNHQYQQSIDEISKYFL